MKRILKTRLNFKLIIPIVILGIFSLVTLYNINPLLADNVAYINFFKKQLIGFILAIIGIIIIYNVNLKNSTKIVDFCYFILVGMLFILGTEIPIISDFFINSNNGADGWFMLFVPKLSFQPVEFFKIFLVLKLSLISKEHLKSRTGDDWLLKKYFLYGFLPIFLVLLEPDLGGVALLGFSMFCMLLASLKSKKVLRNLLILSGVGLLFLLLLIFSDAFGKFIVDITPLHSYQLRRLDAWLEPFSTSEGYQLTQSLILMGSSGASGYGGGFSQINIPEAQTDLIFSAFVGFYGYVLGLILIFDYFFIIYQILNLASLQRDLYFKFICIGFGGLFFLQVVENIGMLIGLFPITGIVLPFMSYGISALLTYSAILGIILNISKETDFEPNKYNKQ